MKLPCATLLEQRQLPFPTHFSLFLLHLLHSENMDKANEILKWAGETEVRNTTNPTRLAQMPFGLLASLVSVERISADHGVLGAMQHGSEGMGPWTDTQGRCPPYITDPEIAGGFRETFRMLKLVLEFLQKWKAVAKLCSWMEGYWRNLMWGCSCVYTYLCPGSLPTINFNKQ